MAKKIYVGTGSARKLKRAYLGVDGKARKLKKIYLGDSSGKARLCWSAGEIAYWGTLDAIGNQYSGSIWGAAENDKYAVIVYYSYGLKLACYNASLTKTVIGASIGTSTMAGTKGARVGNYALFAGSGTNSSETNGTILAIDQALTVTNPGYCNGYNQMSANVGKYVIFAGGAYTSKEYDDEDEDDWSWETELLTDASALDTSLTRVSVASLGQRKVYGSGGSIGNYAVFAGGTYNPTVNPNTYTYAYDSSLTLRKVSNETVAGYRETNATIGSHLVYPNGKYNSNVLTTCLCYDTSLTKTEISGLSPARCSSAGAALGDYAVFAGGYTGSYSSSKDVTLMDENLTQQSGHALDATHGTLYPAKVGEYLLLFGTSQSDKTNVYVLD